MAKYDFFISYSSKDEEIAFRIVNAIESAGYTCWIAPRNIPYGTPYASAIMEGIDGCDKFIVLITKNSVKSNDVLNEVDNAHAAKKTIIPVRLTDTELPRELNYYLSRTQWLSVPASKPEEIVSRLQLETNSINPTHIPTPDRAKNQTKGKILAISIASIIILIGAVVMILRFSACNSTNTDENASLVVDNESDSTTTTDSVIIDETLTYQSGSETTEHVKTIAQEPTKKENFQQTSNEIKKSEQPTVNYKDMLLEANTYYNDKEYAKALPLYEKIADGSDINYATKVGWMYQQGEGVTANPIKAIEWYTKAADSGNSRAQNLLAELYLKGQDFDGAAKYYLKADENGALSPVSLNNLGYLYYNGLGVSKDLDKAKYYWTEAAKNGNKIAKSNLEKYFKE